MPPTNEEVEGRLGSEGIDDAHAICDAAAAGAAAEPAGGAALSLSSLAATAAPLPQTPRWLSPLSETPPTKDVMLGSEGMEEESWW